MIPKHRDPALLALIAAAPVKRLSTKPARRDPKFGYITIGHSDKALRDVDRVSTRYSKR